MNHRGYMKRIEEKLQGWSGCSSDIDFYNKIVEKLQTNDAQQLILRTTNDLILKIEKEEQVSGLNSDYPTFLLWNLSLMLVSRTSDILKSKSEDKQRELECGGSNLKAFRRVYENYRKELESLVNTY